MKRATHISVDSIARGAAVWAFAGTAMFVFVSAIVALVYGLKVGIDKEDARLRMSATKIAREVAGELLVNDGKSIDLTIDNLMKEFRLSDLKIENTADACAENASWWSRFPKNVVESCLQVPMRELGQSRSLVIKSRDRQLVSASWLYGILWFCIAICLFGAFVTYRIRRDLRRSIVEPIKKLAANPESWKETDPYIAQEITTLHSKLRAYMSERDLEKDKAQALITQASIGEMAAQVAHDIRSPLAALDMLAGSLLEISEEKRVLMRSAISRIKDIANWLVDRQRAALKKAGPVSLKKGKKTELLSDLVETLISEKRMQYRGRLGLEIELALTSRAYGLFAMVHGTEFKRVLSNLIDNAAEALEEFGRIVVEMYSNSASVFVVVRDNGKGIPAEILPRLMEKGSSFGKKKGAGLGLYHARSVIEGWGGTISIESKIGKGTAVEIQLPRGAVPDWFASELVFNNQSLVVVLDDDTSIHQIWEGRFRSLKSADREIHLIHLSSADALLKWHAHANEEDKSNARYLVDYELVGEERNGLDLISELGIANRSVLVTSRSEEFAIRSGCRRLKVSILPKGLAGFIPIRLVERERESEVQKRRFKFRRQVTGPDMHAPA